MAEPAFTIAVDNRGIFRMPALPNQTRLQREGIILAGCRDHLQMWSRRSWESAQLGDAVDYHLRDLRRLDRIEIKTLEPPSESKESPAESNDSPRVLIVPASEQLISILKTDPTRLWELGPEQLEAFVAERLERMGFVVVQIGRTRTPDGGIDFVVCPRDPQPFPYLLAVEVKSHRDGSSTSVSAVRNFYGAIQGLPVRGGVLITNTTFTMDARWFAEQRNHLITLRDFDHLSCWIRDDFALTEPLRDLPAVMHLRKDLKLDVHGWIRSRLIVPTT